MDHEGRIRKVQAKLSDAAIDGLLVSNLANVRYLTGFSGTNAQVLVTLENATFFSDGRYRARAASLVTAADIVIYDLRLSEELAPRATAAGLARLGIEGDTVTLSARDDLAREVADVELVPTRSVVEDLRRVKEPAEVDALRAAITLGDETFAWILDRLSPGATEREIALQLEVRLRTEGAEAVSFDPIVGSGPLSAHIHHTAGDRVLEKGDLVLLDFGCVRGGYCSDLTRTVVLGPASDDQRDVYDTVLAAQSAGIAAVVAGKACSDVDGAARAVVESAGHGAAFAHGLGHGVGLEIHEGPRLNRDSTATLAAGDVVTIEPGIYLEDGGGIRIEDCVLVTADGAEVLSGAPKDTLLEL